MKNIIKKYIFPNTFALVAVFGIISVPVPALANQYDDWYTGGYDTYGDSYGWSSGGYDTYEDYSSWYSGGYDTYEDYSDWYSGGYDTYEDYSSWYSGGNDTYEDSYDWYSGGYDAYEDSYDWYSGGYDVYEDSYDWYSGGYDTYEDYVTYDDNSYDYDSYYDDEVYYDDYYEDDYGYYDDGSYYGGGSNCGSNCYTPRPQPCRTNCNPPAPQPDNLKVICVPSDRNIEAGDTVTFTAEVTGGKAPYSYRWTGDISSTSRVVSVRFDDEGNYTVTVRVTDKKGRTATDDCDVKVEEDDEDEDFDAICVPSKTTVDKGDRVTFEARVEGGDRPYDYDWSGDADGDDDEVTVRFNREGRYTINLKVTDDEGRTARDTCEVRVKDEDDDDDDRDVHVTTETITTTPPTVGSVYLNQVPYTGPEDVAKGAAFVGILLAWSAAGAMILKKRKAKAEVSSRVTAFKEANKLAKA